MQGSGRKRAGLEWRGGKRLVCPAGGTEPAEKSISEQARAEFGDTACTVFREPRLHGVFPTGCRGCLQPSPSGRREEGRGIPFVCVQSLQSRAIHQFAVVDEKKRGGEGDRAEKNVPIVKVPRG